MDAFTAIDMARQAILTTAILISPALAIALIVGCAMSLLQAVTQVQDQAISFIPKLLAVAATILLCLPWMVEYFVQYARQVIIHIPETILGG